MKKVKRKLTAVEALSKIRTTPKVALDVPQPRENLKTFSAAYDAEQYEKNEAPLRAVKSEHSRLLQQLIDQDTPIVYVAESSFLTATAPSIGDGSQFNNIPPEAIKATIRRIFSEFEDSIKDEGTLTASGRQKLQNLSRANLSIDWLQVSSWKQALYLLRAVGELTDQGDSETPDFVVKEVEPQETPTVDADSAIEKLDTTTRDGQKKARTLLANYLFSVDAKSVFDEWIASLSNNFDFMPTEDQQRAALDIFIERNLSFLSRKSYDDVRKVLVARGMFPERCLTNEDRAAILVEATDARSYQERQDLKAKLALLREGKRPN
jgi:hypothetical protein